MNANDFLDLAAKLCADAGAAEMRSATSRAYYAAFHSASDLVRSVGIHLPKGPECHTKLARILANAGDLDVAAAGARLDTLRARRMASSSA